MQLSTKNKTHQRRFRLSLLVGLSLLPWYGIATVLAEEGSLSTDLTTHLGTKGKGQSQTVQRREVNLVREDGLTPTPDVRKATDKLQHHQILLLNSYNKGYTWTDNEVAAIEGAFPKETNIVLRVEYMDAKWLNNKEYFSLLEQLFAYKYKNTTFDVIIATDDDALKFLRQYHQALFPGTPVVFAGINNFNESKIAGFDNVTGVNEQADFSSNLELILQIQPATKNVYVISDDLTAGRLIRKEFNASAIDYRNRLQFHHLTNLSMLEIQNIVAKLGPDAVVFYLTFFRDGAGENFSPWEAITMISRSASVPLYGQVDYMLGKGLLGGRMKSSSYQGEAAAKLAHRVLSGEAASDIPIIMEGSNHYMFDYNQLLRFDIPVAALPQSSIIINEPQHFYYKYKVLIWTVLTVIALLLGFIFILLFNIRKRKRAQKGLRDIIGAIGSVLVQGSPDNIREALTNIIHQAIFLEKEITQTKFFSYSGTMKQFEPDLLVPLLPHEEEVPHEASERLIRQSIEQDNCMVHGNECVALFKSSSIPGNVIYLKGKRYLDDMDRDLLEILTNNVSMAMESLEKNKIQESLETARKIQQSMLPHDFDAVTAPFSIDIHAHLIAAKEVGGDFYDIFAIDEEHLCLSVGDVSGKGIPAALFMAMAKTLIRSDAEHELEPEKILSSVNNNLFRGNEQCMFVTLFLAIFNCKTGVLKCANGGHNPPALMAADGSVSWLQLEKGLALGVMEDIEYLSQSITLRSGEGLFVYTDGVTEAMNTDSELFETARLHDLLLKNSHLNAEALITRVLEEVDTFSRGAGQADDITVLFIRNEAQQTT